MKTVDLHTVANTKDSIRNYTVYVSLFGYKGIQDSLRVHVGLASPNHLATIRGFVDQKFSGERPEIVRIDVDNGRFEFGVGKPQSRQDR